MWGFYLVAAGAFYELSCVLSQRVPSVQIVHALRAEEGVSPDTGVIFPISRGPPPEFRSRLDTEPPTPYILFRNGNEPKTIDRLTAPIHR